MDILLILQDLPINTTPPVENIKGIFAWIIGLLVTFVVVILRIITVQNKQHIDNLKSQIVDLKLENSGLISKLDEEIKYNKDQGVSTMKLITDVNHILGTLTKASETMQIDISKEVTPILKDNNSIVTGIRKHLQDNGRG